MQHVCNIFSVKDNHIVMFAGSLHMEAATFQTSTEWSKYSASLTATATTDRVDVRSSHYY